MSPTLVLLLACRPAPDRADQDVQPEDADPEGFLLVDAGSVGEKWSAASGWVIAAADVLGDVTGDGVADAAVLVAESSWSSQLLFVAGPLRRSLTLPGDEFGSIPNASIQDGVGDAQGDGSISVHVAVLPDMDTYLVDGPFNGAIDATVAGTLIDRHVTDIDGDGILDLYTSATGEVHITWGPSSRWTGVPDLVVRPTCDEPYGFGWVHRLEGYPDLDGDGRREVWLDGDGYTCGAWLFPLPSAGGPYVPADDPDAVYGVRDPSAIGDQTGDGVADVWTWWDKTVSAAPVAFAGEGVTSPQRTAADPDLLQVYPVPFDLDGDKLTDFVGLDAEIDTSEVQVSIEGPIDPVSGEVLVLVPADELEGPMYATAWDIEGRVFRGAFLEDGVVGALVQNEQEIVVVDLGAGSAP